LNPDEDEKGLSVMLEIWSKSAEVALVTVGKMLTKE